MGEKRSGSVVPDAIKAGLSGKGTMNNSPRIKRQFRGNTNSTKDLDIQTLIKKYPIKKDKKVE